VRDNSRAKVWAEDFLGEFLNEISKGDSHQIFTHKKVNIVPLICYETVFPIFVAQAVGQTTAHVNKSLGTLMLGFSNDGWFGSTHQSYQHIMASVLRAVENRLPLVHVVNNGPSIVVQPNGKIVFTSDFQQASGYVVDVPINHSVQGSFYSHHPHLFNYFVYVMLFLSVLIGRRNPLPKH
jgi:apolipoprotein N-acyltransferase